MSTPLNQDKTLTFQAFWAWLKEHANCVVAASWEGGSLFDHDAFHWLFLEEDERQMVLQLVIGKTLVGELIFDGQLIDEVQVVPDPDGVERGQCIAEFLSAPSSGRETLGHVVLAHSIDQAKSHQEFRH